MIAMTTSTLFRMCDKNTSCEFYLQVKNKRYTAEALLHMDENHHEKLSCPLGQQCDGFIRLNENGYQQQDLGHCAIYFHPRQRSGLTVEENIHSKKFISAYLRMEGNGTTECRVSTSLGKEGDLLSELKLNCFDHVLLLNNGPYSFLSEVANEKLKHPRHVQMGSPLSHDQMLAIILYTDTVAYADLRLDEIRYCQQNPSRAKYGWHLQKWPIFGALLDSAIRLLDKHDDKKNRPQTVYHGLESIELDISTFNNHGSRKSDKCFKYGTFVSTSWDKQVSLGFIAQQGCLLIIDTSEQPDIGKLLIGADVSWISKFAMECEFLIARKPIFEITAIEFNSELNCQLVRLKNGNNLNANSN